VGRSVEDILREWHGPEWTEIEARYGVHPTLARINEEAFIGDPLNCLSGGAARRLNELARSQKQSLFRAYATIIESGDAAGSIESVLLEAASREEFNPGLLEVYSEGDAWEEAVKALSADCVILKQMALQCCEEAIGAVARDVESLSASVKPYHGHLFFGPFWAPAPLEYDYKNAIYGRHLFLSGGDAEECGMFFFSYAIDLHKDPIVLSALQALSNERAALQQKVKNYILSLPKKY
jgi:hypothetical protein